MSTSAHFTHNTSSRESDELASLAALTATVDRRREALAAARPTYADLRASGAPAPERAKQLATSKTVFTREALRAAARRSLSAQAQAVYAILIAESWWDDQRSAWRLRMSQQQLASRLSASVDSVRRWLNELVTAGVLTIIRGHARTVNRYLLAALNT